MWKKIKKKINGLTPAQAIVSYYLLAVTVSALLLSIPIARNEEASWSFIDALFTAVSAVSVTGLTTINIAETFNTFGIFILMFVLQFGGIGIMTLGTFFWMLLGKKIGLKERRLIMTDQNQVKLAGLVDLLKHLLVIIILIEIIGALILGTYFLRYYPTWQDAYLHGVFASVSATTNAGFDITGASMRPYANDYFVQLINMLLIVLGAIGFPVLIEVKNYLFNKRGRLGTNFSLYTKLTTSMYFILVFVGALFIFLFEFGHYFQGESIIDSVFYSFFQSVSTRSAGLVTLDTNGLSEPTLLVMSALMFIGASPSSVGGGIRTTTFALNLLFFYHYAKGHNSIKVFNREVHEDDIIKSLLVTTFAVILCFFSVVLLSFTEKHSILQLLFEVTSAFGTSGMSMGITSELTVFGKVVVILLMFIGRVGILSFIFMIGGKERKENFHYPKERVIIG